jgi:hypothetical protein
MKPWKKGLDIACGVISVVSFFLKEIMDIYWSMITRIPVRGTIAKETLWSPYF